MTKTLLAANDITFEDAIAFTQALLAQLETQALSEADEAAAIASLIGSENGARGFFVTYLTDERSLADQPSSAVVRGLQTAPDHVAELLVKNVAMSSAMAITHRRNEDETMAQNSQRVRSRTTNLIHLTQIPLVTEKAQQLVHSAVTGAGDYQTFLNRWGYDAEQRQVIAEALEQVLVS